MLDIWYNVGQLGWSWKAKLVKRSPQVEPEVATDRSPEPRTTTEEPLPGYSSEDNNDLPGYATDDLPGYAEEDLSSYSDEDLSGYVDEDLSGYATDLPPPLPFPTFEITTEGSMMRA